MQNVALSYGVNKWKVLVSLALTYGKIVEFAKYFKTDEVWGEELLAQMPEYRGKNVIWSALRKWWSKQI